MCLEESITNNFTVRDLRPLPVTPINEFGPVSNGQNQVAREYGVEFVLSPGPGLFHVIQLESAIRWDPIDIR
jgi:hypothetical protein